MNVLLAFEYPSLNGGENSMLAIVPHLQEHGVRYCAVAPGEGPLAAAITDLGVELIPYEDVAHEVPRHAKAQFLETIARTVQPDLLHANSLSMSRLVGPMSDRLKIPAIGHIRDMMNLNQSAIADLNRNNVNICVSLATLEWYLERGLESDRAVVIYNGVDGTTFRPRTNPGILYGELGIPADYHLVVTIGQIGLRKGMDVFLAAAKKVAQLRTDVVFAIVGERHSQKQESIEFESNLRHLSHIGALRDRIFFLGRRSNVPDLLNETTILVHLARQEPLGRVLLEAGACGCCILATEVGGTPEIFPKALDCAELVAVDDPNAVAQRLVQLLDDSKRRKLLGENARKRVVSKFHVKRTAVQLFQQYGRFAGI